MRQIVMFFFNNSDAEKDTRDLCRNEHKLEQA